MLPVLLMVYRQWVKTCFLFSPGLSMTRYTKLLGVRGEGNGQHPHPRAEGLPGFAAACPVYTKKKHLSLIHLSQKS